MTKYRIEKSRQPLVISDYHNRPSCVEAVHLKIVPIYDQIVRHYDLNNRAMGVTVAIIERNVYDIRTSLLHATDQP